MWNEIVEAENESAKVRRFKMLSGNHSVLYLEKHEGRETAGKPFEIDNFTLSKYVVQINLYALLTFILEGATKVHSSIF